MNFKKYSISMVSMVAVLIVAGFVYEMVPDVSVDDRATPIPPSEPKYVPTLADFGTATLEEKISDKAPTKIAKFADISGIDPMRADTVLLQIKEDKGYVYYLYGPPGINVSPDTSVKEFSDAGGLIVRTIVTTNPAAALRHIDKTASNYFETNGMSAYWHESTLDYPAYLEIYPGDERKVTVIANNSIDGLVEIAKQLDITPGELDLEKYPEIPYSPDPAPMTETEIKNHDAMKSLRNAFDENVIFGTFPIKDVVVGYGVGDNVLVVDIATKYYESENLAEIKQQIQEIVGNDVSIELSSSEPISPINTESVFPYIWNGFLHHNGIEFTPKEQSYFNDAIGYRPNTEYRVCSPIVSKNQTEFYISSTFFVEPFAITGTFLDKTKPDNCYKIWKTDSILTEPDRTLELWLENYRKKN